MSVSVEVFCNVKMVKSLIGKNIANIHLYQIRLAIVLCGF